MLKDEVALYTELSGKDGSNTSIGVIGAYLDGYEKGKSERKKGEWIPCSERLPEESGQYYVSGGDKVWICEFLIISSFTGGWCNDALNPRVQAWMEKPEPYRGEA